MAKIKRKQAILVQKNGQKTRKNAIKSKNQHTNVINLNKSCKRKLSASESISKKRCKSLLPIKNQPDSIIIVWLDIKNTDYLNRKASLHLIANYLKLFDNVDACIDYLLSSEMNNMQQKVFLVVSGMEGRKIVPLVYDQWQICCIYIFCANKEKHEEWTQKYMDKIKGIHVDKHQLITQLGDDISFYSKFMSMSIVPPCILGNQETSSRNLNREQVLFIWYQLLMEILKRMPSTLDSRGELVEECRHEYVGNITELNKIQQFVDDYHSDDVIAWYTRDSFLYRLLNKALRTQDIFIIYQFRFVLTDLHHRLAQLHREYIRSFKDESESSSVLIVFRGQGMPADELRKLEANVNGHMAMNSFLSTSTSSEIALGFTGHGTGRPLVESVFFEIHCPIKEYPTKPFASIQNYSYQKLEYEVLFTLGTTFLIDSIETLTDEIWHIKLTLCDDEDDSNQNELIDHFKSDIGVMPEIGTIASLLLRMNEFDKAERFYNLVVKNIPSDHYDRISIKQCVGTIYFMKGNYMNALKCYKQALKLNRRLMPRDFVLMSVIFNNIGNTYNKLGNYRLALKYHRKTLRIQEKRFHANHVDLAKTFNHLGDVYKCLNKYNLALKNHEKAKDIQIKSLPVIHPDLGETWNNIGEVYLCSGNFETARIHFEKALEVKLKSLPDQHSSLSNTYSDLGCVYDELGQSEKAIEYHQKALDIGLKSRVEHHPHLAIVYTGLAECYTKLDDSTSALFYFKKALQIRLRSLPVDHPDIIASYNDLGAFYTDEEKHKLAMKYLKKAKLQSSSIIISKAILASIHCNLGTLYAEKFQSKKAIKYYNKAISLELECDESNTSRSLADAYTALGQVYLTTDDLANSLIQFEKALVIGENCLNLKFDDNPIQLTLYSLVDVYKRKNDYTTALNYAEKLLNIQLKNPTIDTDDLAGTYFIIGFIHYYLNDHRKAIINYRKALQSATFTDSDQSGIYYYLACVYFEQNDLNAAMENYENALKLFPEQDKLMASTYENLASIHYFKRDYKKSLHLYHKALQSITDDIQLKSSIYCNIGRIYDDQKNFKRALKFYKRAVNALFKNEEQDEAQLIEIYENISDTHMQTLNYHKGLAFCQKALQLRLESVAFSQDDTMVASTYDSLGLFYFYMRDYSLSLKHFEKALQVASKSLTSDHPHVVEYRNHIASAKRYLHYQAIERI